MFSTVTSLYSNLGWTGKTYVYTHAPACVTWALGATEGAVRTAFHAVATVFSYVTKQPEKTQKHFDLTKRAFNVTRGTTTLAVVSAIPLVGFYGDGYLIEQCKNYAKSQGAIKRAEQKLKVDRIGDIFQQLKAAESISEKEIQSAFIAMDKPVHVTDFLDRDRHIKGSLIRYLTVYKIIYKGGEYTCTGISKGVRITYRIAIRLFAFGFFRKVAKAAVVAVRDEFQQTLTMAAVDKSYHPVYKKEERN